MTPRIDHDLLARAISEPAPRLATPNYHAAKRFALLVDEGDGNAAETAPAPERLLRLACRERQTSAQGIVSRGTKRLLDIVAASALILATMPFMVAAGIAVGVTSHGPILFSQKRCGRNGHQFKMLKFRTMVHGADQLAAQMAAVAASTGIETTDAPMFKSADDPRVTKVGRWLRRTSVDELPQLFNVLAGHMSLVGPRPLVPAEAAELDPKDAEQRQSVRPGLTCLWQVLRRDDTSFAERIELDVLYAKRRTLALDVALIAMTPIAIVGGNGSF